MARIEQFIMDTVTDTAELERIIVRPSYLTNGEKTGIYRVSPRYAPECGTRISRADLADFMLKQLNADTYVRQTPAVAY